MYSESAIHQFVSTFEPLFTANSRAGWNLASTGEKRYEQEIEQLSGAIRQKLSDRSSYQSLLRITTPNDPLLARQLDMVRRTYQEHQLPADLIRQMVQLEVTLDSKFTTFRASINGEQVSDNSLREKLRGSSNSAERRAIWEASKQIGAQVEETTLELARIRNGAARMVGFSNFYSMRLQLQELDETRLFEILKALEEATNPLWARWRQEFDHERAARFGIGAADLRPWHFDDPFFQEGPDGSVDLDPVYANTDVVAISRQFFAAIGLPVDAILARSDLFERTAKNQHAFCTTIGRTGDVRILCNVRPNERWMSVQLHELGHAVYDFYIGNDLPYLLREPAHILSTEAIAMLFGRLSKDGDFIRRYVDPSGKHAELKTTELARHTAVSLLVFTRWVLVMTHFERAMYQDPSQDLRTLWWDLVERFQGVTRPDERHAPDWASKVHLSCSPAYYQNYILGEMNASQIRHALERDLGGTESSWISSPRTGDWLKRQIFSVGASYPWEEMLQRATGERLQPAYFTADLGAVL